MRAPRIVGILASAVALYGVWLVQPRWITGALGLLILYAVLTNADRFSSLFDQFGSGLRVIIAPDPSRRRP